MSDRERASDNRRNGAADRASFMSDNDDLMEFNTIGDEIAAGYTVGPNAPCGGSPTSYVVGTRGGPLRANGVEEPD